MSQYTDAEFVRMEISDGLSIRVRSKDLKLIDGADPHYKYIHKVIVPTSTDPCIVECDCGRTIHVVLDDDEIEAVNQIPRETQ